MKKNIYVQAPHFYISKKPAKFEASRLSCFRVIVVTDLENMVSRKTHSKVESVFSSTERFSHYLEIFFVYSHSSANFARIDF